MRCCTVCSNSTTLPIMREWRDLLERDLGLKFAKSEQLPVARQIAMAYWAVQLPVVPPMMRPMRIAFDAKVQHCPTEPAGHRRQGMSDVSAQKGEDVEASWMPWGL